MASLLTKAEAAEKKEEEEQAQARRDEIISQIEADLDAGTSMRRLRQKLLPRVFVLDFNDCKSWRKRLGHCILYRPLLLDMYFPHHPTHYSTRQKAWHALNSYFSSTSC